jgi:hypothetical protein
VAGCVPARSRPWPWCGAPAGGRAGRAAAPSRDGGQRPDGLRSLVMVAPAPARGGGAGRLLTVCLSGRSLGPGAVWLLVVRAGRSAALGGDMASVPTVAPAGDAWHRLRHGVVLLVGGPGCLSVWAGPWPWCGASAGGAAGLCSCWVKPCGLLFIPP